MTTSFRIIIQNKLHCFIIFIVFIFVMLNSACSDLVPFQTLDDRKTILDSLDKFLRDIGEGCYVSIGSEAYIVVSCDNPRIDDRVFSYVFEKLTSLSYAPVYLDDEPQLTLIFEKSSITFQSVTKKLDDSYLPITQVTFGTSTTFSSETSTLLRQFWNKQNLLFLRVHGKYSSKEIDDLRAKYIADVRVDSKRRSEALRKKQVPETNTAWEVTILNDNEVVDFNLLSTN